MTISKTGKAASSPEALFNEALTRMQKGDAKGAVTLYKRLLEQFPGNADLNYALAMAAAHADDVDTAITALEEVVTAKPDHLEAWNNLGLARQQLRDFEGAAEAYGKVRALKPDLPVGHKNYGNVAQLLERFDEAADAYEAALKLTPDDADMWGRLARAEVNLGRWQETVRAADRNLDLVPGDTGSLALKTAAFTELGEDDALRTLLDFDRFIEEKTLDVPAAYGDRAAFHEALKEHCFSHHSVTFQPGDRSTSNGHQTTNLSLDEDTGPVGHLLEKLTEAVEAYQQSHPISPDHPFVARHPKAWKYDIWATALGTQGFHKPHIHRDGWLSGCYYVQIPDVVTDVSDDKAGWIEFGRAPDNAHAKADPRVRAYRPYEGMVILFPSYFYHRTIPFSSNDKRITLAFDIMPTEW